MLIGYRKVIIMTIIIIVGIVFRPLDLLTGDQFVSLLNTCGIAFFGSNLISKVTKIFDKKGD